jgi:lipid-A-disaccharide synthase
MRIAKWAKALGMKTHYYISPQIWAWKESRISAIKRDIDKMYVILPFENNFTKTNTTFLLRSLDIRSSMLFKISLQSMPLL